MQASINLGASFFNQPNQTIMKKVLTGIVTILGALYGIYEFYDTFIGGDDYGSKIEIGTLEVYYTVNADEMMATKLGNYLDSTDFTGGDAMSIQLDKLDSTYQVNLSLKDGVANNDEYAQLFRNVVNDIKTNVFPNDNLTLNLCNNTFDTQQAIPYDEIIHKPYGDLKMFNGTEVYYRGVSQTKIDDFGNYLIESGFADGNGRSFQLTQNDSILTVNMLVEETYVNNPEYKEVYENFRLEIMKGAFDNESIEFHLSHEPFQSMQIFN